MGIVLNFYSKYPLSLPPEGGEKKPTNYQLWWLVEVLVGTGVVGHKTKAVGEAKGKTWASHK